jgi:ASC-1-like (ASCH) protein
MMIDVNAFLYEVFAQSLSSGNQRWVAKLLNSQYKRVHLAILIEPYLSLLLKGEKTIESRFSQRKITPFREVSIGDVVLLKKSGGDIAGVFEVSKAHFFELKTEEDLVSIRNEYGHRMRSEEQSWKRKKKSRYATLIEVGSLMKLEPIPASFKNNRQAWIAGSFQQARPCVICISGDNASAKAQAANELADIIKCQSYSVSDFLKDAAKEREAESMSQEACQILIREGFDNGWRALAASFLEYAGWDDSRRIIVEDIMHVEFLSALTSAVEPLGCAVSVFASAPELKLSEESFPEHKHEEEKGLSSLRETADILVQSNSSGGEIISFDALKRLFHILYSFQNDIHPNIAFQTTDTRNQALKIWRPDYTE